MGDEEVKGTADDSTVSKAYCCNLGYLRDPYVRYFSRGSAKRPPIINRGYWARVNRVWITLTRFLEQSGPNSQIVSLGAGYDTNYWLLRDKFPQLSFSYTELDFPDVCARKIATISLNSDLLSRVPGEVIASSTEIRTEGYKLLNCDLRDTQGVVNTLKGATSADVPTLVFAECVLVYLEPQFSDGLLREIAGMYSNVGMLSYDAINPNDAFGREMTENLATRGITLRGIHKYPSVLAHERRLQALFPRTEVRNMLDIYNNFTDPVERRRTERLEIFDEFEEWNLIMTHYCMSLACKGSVLLSFS